MSGLRMVSGGVDLVASAARLAAMLERYDCAAGDAMIIVPPGATLERPAIGPHLLAACAQAEGFRVSVVYANMLFAAAAGMPAYEALCEFSIELWGERVFAKAAYGKPGLGPADRIVCKSPFGLDNSREQLSSRQLRRLTTLAVKWADLVSSVLAKSSPKVIGCATMFQQNAPSVALLDRLKRQRPDRIAIIGGANCEGEMAEGVLTLCDQIDYAFSGESDETFPAFLRTIREGRLPSRGVIAGSPVLDLDKLPLPDYTAYFEQLESFVPDYLSKKRDEIWLSYESSRGCWWGQKHHCTFCGLNGQGMQFRAKSPQRVIADLRQLVKKHPNRKVMMCDNIMPYTYFRTLLPRLASEVPNLHVFYEQKSNLSLEQVLSLRRAGVFKIQPGIESLSTPLLKRMKKGVSARQNIALLRYARTAGLLLNWNLLYGFPGDKVAEYEPMLSLLPWLWHLHPPMGVYSICLDRFSPYYFRADEFGIKNIRPAACYAHILPASADARKVAYQFEAEFESESMKAPELFWLMQYEIAHWKKSWAGSTLPVLELKELAEDRFELKDTRLNRDAPKISLLTREQATLALTGVASGPAPAVSQALESGWIVELEGALVPLVTAEPELLARFEHNASSARRENTAQMLIVA